MLKITKSIVNLQRSLIGFMIEGKESEFGGFSNEKIERGIPTNKLIAMKFSNNQISTVKNKIVERNNFKINSLPMVVFTDNGYIPMDNTVNIIKRFVQDNKNIGFRVQFADGSEDNFKYENVLMLCKWFKPGNFAIRTSAKGLVYICGKQGTSLDKIPAEIIGEEAEKKTKRMKSAAKEKTNTFNGAFENGCDILDVYEFIADCGGCVIKLPNEEYTAKTTENAESEGFTSLGIGEVASARPEFNATKINVNAGFKKVGFIEVPVNGVSQKITTFVYRKKSIFYNGDNNMKKFGIAVPTENEEELIKKIGSSLALEKITDTAITAPLGQVIDAKSLSFYRVDASKIDLISKEKRKNSVLTSKKLVDICKKKYVLKLIEKALGPKGGLLKELKNELTDEDIAKATNKKIAGMFAMFNKEALDVISSSGIDVYTGAYNAPASSNKNGAKSGGTSEETQNVEVEYILKGYDAGKLTGSKILTAVRNNDTTAVPQEVIEKIIKIESISDAKERYAKATKMYNTVLNKEADLDKKLWMHIASMYINGNKAKIHTHDAKYWTPDISSRVKTANVYQCNAKGCEGLTIKFKGVEI